MLPACLLGRWAKGMGRCVYEAGSHLMHKNISPPNTHCWLHGNSDKPASVEEARKEEGRSEEKMLRVVFTLTILCYHGVIALEGLSEGDVSGEVSVHLVDGQLWVSG